MTIQQLYKEYDEQCAIRYICHDLRLYESTLMSSSPFSLKQLDPTGWRFSWYAPNETHKWNVEDLFIDGEYIYIGAQGSWCKARHDQEDTTEAQHQLGEEDHFLHRECRRVHYVG